VPLDAGRRVFLTGLLDLGLGRFGLDATLGLYF